jgi:hypothetical protein
MKTKLMIQTKKSPLGNERGVALAIAIMVVGTLITLSLGFASSTMTELRSAQYYRNSAKAFWMASSGISEFLNNTHYLDSGQKTINFGSNTVVITKDDSSPTQRIVRAIASVGTARRGIQVTFAGSPPDLFGNTMTSGNNFSITGILARLDANGKTRIGGIYSKSGLLAEANFQDKLQNQGTATTTLKYPDRNNNGTSDEFADFVQFYRNEMATRPSSETIWIQPANPNDTVWVYPNQQLAGKKLIFVDTTEGKGDVNIIFDASWRNNQNLTIVTTGDITYYQPLNVAADSKLNLVSWKDYNEASILYSAHHGVTYAHNDADYFSVLNYSHTTGNVVANHDLNAFEALTWKVFDFVSPIDAQGNVPPGFQGLMAQSAGGYSSTPDSWKEI